MLIYLILLFRGHASRKARHEHRGNLAKIKAKGLPHIVGRGGVKVQEIAAACDGKVTLPPAKERDPNEVDLPFSC